MEEAEATTREEAVAGESRKLLFDFLFSALLSAVLVFLFFLLCTSSHLFLPFYRLFLPINSYGGGGGYGQQQGGGGGYGGR